MATFQAVTGQKALTEQRRVGKALWQETRGPRTRETALLVVEAYFGDRREMFLVPCFQGVSTSLRGSLVWCRLVRDSGPLERGLR